MSNEKESIPCCTITSIAALKFIAIIASIAGTQTSLKHWAKSLPKVGPSWTSVRQVNVVPASISLWCLTCSLAEAYQAYNPQKGIWERRTLLMPSLAGLHVLMDRLRELLEMWHGFSIRNSIRRGRAVGTWTCHNPAYFKTTQHKHVREVQLRSKMGMLNISNILGACAPWLATWLKVSSSALPCNPIYRLFKGI